MKYINETRGNDGKVELNSLYLNPTSLTALQYQLAFNTSLNTNFIMSKLLTVFGATGNQGGSVIKAILNDPVLSKEFRIRAVTRDVSKPAAKELVAKGVEVIAVSRPWL
jgi:hypothetical protein